MRPKNLVPALIALLWLAPAHPADSCVCLKPPGPRRALREASAVFVGRVLEIEDPEWGFGFVRLEIDRAWKGIDRGTGDLRVFAPDGESCGFSFDDDRDFLVYAHRSQPENWASSFGEPGAPDGALLVSSCSRTTSLDRAGPDLERLGAPEWSQTGVAERQLQIAAFRILIEQYDALEPQFDDPVGRRYCLAVRSAAGSGGKAPADEVLQSFTDHPHVHAKGWCRRHSGRYLRVGPILWQGPHVAHVWTEGWVPSRPGGSNCLRRFERVDGGWRGVEECIEGAIYD